MPRLVIHYMVLGVCLLSIFKICGQASYDRITYPDCKNARSMEFDAQKILSSENRFLYDGSLEKITALYCYAKRTENLELEALGLMSMAEQYLKNTISNPFELGLAYINKSIEICKENGYVKTLLSAKETLCSYLNSYGMLDEAHVCCKEFLDIARSSGDSVRIAEGYMLLGRVLRDREEYVKSDSVLQKSLGFLQDDPASNRIGVFAHLHLSALARVQKNYKEALDYAKKGLALSKGTTQRKEFMQALLGQQIVLCQLELGDYDNEEMFALIKRNAQEESWVTGYYHDTRGHYFKTKGQIDSAIVHYGKALEYYEDRGLNNRVINTSEDLLHTMWIQNKLSDRAYDVHKSVQEAVDRLEGERKRITSFERTYYQLKDEEHRSENLQKRIKGFYSILLLTSGAIVCLLFTGFLIYKQYRLKKRYNEELNGLNSTLIEKNRKLIASKELIEEQNQRVQSELKTQLVLISGYGDQLKKLKRTFEDNPELDPDFKTRISKMLDFKKNKDVVEDINIKFLEANKELVSKLSHNYPNLTNNDLKLCLYLKMSLSTKEIAQLQHKTTDSIKVARSRLRKKMGIFDPSVKLTTFINSI